MDKKTIKRLLTYCKPYRFLIMLLTLLSSVIEQTYFYWNCYFNYFFDSMDHGTNYKYNYL